MVRPMIVLILVAVTIASRAAAQGKESRPVLPRRHVRDTLPPMGMRRNNVLFTKNKSTPISTPHQLDTAASIARLLRGGGSGEDVDGTTPRAFGSSRMDLLNNPMAVASYSAAAVLAGLTEALVRKVPRSGGHAPRFANFIRSLLPFVSPDVAAVGFHLAYVAHTLLILYVMPRSLQQVVFSPGGVILLGTVFPIVESIRAASTDSVGDDTTWLQYWIMHGIFSYSTEFVDQIAERYPWVGQHWYALEFYLILWLILPFTDGAAILYELVTKPYIVPMVEPVVKRCEGWLTTLALTIVNASHFWFVSIFFMALPTVLKRFAVIVTGTAFPILATVVAVSAKVDGGDTRWLTYWASFSSLYLTMHAVEKFAGYIPGLYTASLALTLYLMLPIFNGSEEVYRKILVPLFRQREALLLKDARTLARDMIKQLPTDRHEEVRKAAAAAFESA